MYPQPEFVMYTLCTLPSLSPPQPIKSVVIEARPTAVVQQAGAELNPMSGALL